MSDFFRAASQWLNEPGNKDAFANFGAAVTAAVTGVLLAIAAYYGKKAGWWATKKGFGWAMVPPRWLFGPGQLAKAILDAINERGSVADLLNSKVIAASVDGNAEFLVFAEAISGRGIHVITYETDASAPVSAKDERRIKKAARKIIDAEKVKMAKTAALVRKQREREVLDVLSGKTVPPMQQASAKSYEAAIEKAMDEEVHAEKIPAPLDGCKGAVGRRCDIGAPSQHNRLDAGTNNAPPRK